MNLVIPDAIMFIGGFLIILFIVSVSRKTWRATKSWLGPLVCIFALYLVWRYTPVGDFIAQTWRMNT